MKKVFRFSKDTIKNQVWESSVIFSNNNVMLYESHIRTDSFKTIKEFEKELTEEEAREYITLNKEFLIEKYNKL